MSCRDCTLIHFFQLKESDVRTPAYFYNPDATIKNNIRNGRSFLAMGEASLPGVFVYVYSYALDDESDSEW